MTAVPKARNRRRRSPSGADAPVVPTLRDVARAAGVSTASVSRALNHPANVSAELVERIAAIARGLGYIPNSAGRALASRHSCLVGVVARLDDHASACMVAQLQTGLDDLGYGLLLASPDSDPARLSTQIRVLRERGAGAIVLAGVPPAAAVEAVTPLRGTPLLTVGFAIPDAPSLDVAHSLAAETASRYLRGLGHRHLAVISAADAAGLIQIAQYVTALRLEIGDVVTVPETPGTEFDPYERGRAAAAQLLSRGDRPSAILCDHDEVAAGAVRACQDAQVAVPGDVSIIGFGDSELARRTSPTLTTLRLPSAALARGIAAHLGAVLSGHDHPEAEPLPLKLIVRASTGQRS